ncbi:MAG: hypothetical protein RLZZ612_1179 [Pseudomonadota bacterium]
MHIVQKGFELIGCEGALLGLRLSSSPRARNLLTQYIQTRDPQDFATCTDRIGWHGTSFVLPHTTITNTDERLVFQSEAAMENTLKARIKQAAAAFVRALVPEAASGQVHRVGMRFALVGAAGELATEAGLTGWPKGEAERAARACFNAWLAARGGIENGEVMSMTRQVRLFLEANGEGRFTWWHRAMDDHNAKTGMRAGFRCLVTDTGERITSNSKHAVHLGDTIEVHDAEKSTSEFYIFPEVFTSEVCKGFDHKAVCKVLKEHGCLVTEEGHYAKSVRLPGIGKTRCYQINSKIFSIDE